MEEKVIETSLSAVVMPIAKITMINKCMLDNERINLALRLPETDQVVLLYFGN